ncbi:uncharacterized protein [Apostichopus japonicus]|uniref:uncharacterized protein n=1 Tax=Stichopus japonicus TaxID=307972 RepID=UPI003AB5A9A0
MRKLKNEVITSYDVTALFTCIPPTDAIKITRECLEKDTTLKDRTDWGIDHIIEAEELYLETTYFSNNEQFHRQSYGCSMGNPICPIIANFVMEWFEQRALNTYPGVPPKLWLRFVDDTFVIISKEEQSTILKTNIKFTQEECHNNNLAFLDCLVQINPKRKLNTVVYCKPTHTDHYLQFGSHHPLIHKLGVICTLHYRADTIISDQSDIPSEKDHIERALKRCGYPNWAFDKAKKQKPDTNQCSTNANPDSESTTKTLITIPYCLGVSERVKNVYKLFDINTAFKPTNKLRGKLCPR